MGTVTLIDTQVLLLEILEVQTYSLYLYMTTTYIHLIETLEPQLIMLNDYCPSECIEFRPLSFF